MSKKTLDEVIYDLSSNIKTLLPTLNCDKIEDIDLKWEPPFLIFKKDQDTRICAIELKPLAKTALFDNVHFLEQDGILRVALDLLEFAEKHPEKEKLIEHVIGLLNIYRQ